MIKIKYLSLAVAAGFVLSAAIALPTFADNQVGASVRGGARFGMHGIGMPPGIVGTVAAINGTTITVNGNVKPNMASTSATAYTVDASSAKVFKNGTTSAVSSIATGDIVMVRGTVTGTNITATVITDGMNRTNGKGEGPEGVGKGLDKKPSSTPPIQGNGQPVIAGNIASISGTTLTVTNASNITYTIDASSAKIVKGGTTTTVSGIAVGDAVIVQGAVNGTAITASSVIDQGVANHASATANVGLHLGFFGSIGNFFKHLFGF